MPENEPDISDLREGWRAIHRRLLRHSDLKLAEKEVLRNLLDRSKDNLSFPSQSTIAWDCNLSRGHVNECLKSLNERGFISKLARKRRGALIYRLNTRALLDWAQTEADPYPLDVLAEQRIQEVGNSDNEILKVRLSDSGCQNTRQPEVNQRSNSSLSEPAPPKRKKPSVTETIVEEVRLEFRDLVDDVDEMLLLAKSSPTFRFAAPKDKKQVLIVLMRQRMLGQRRTTNGQVEKPPTVLSEWSAEETAARGMIFHHD